MPEVLAIDWQRDRPRCLVARVSRERIEFISAFEEEWTDGICDVTDPQATADWLQTVCRTHSVSPQRLLVVQPREAVVSRRLDLPDVPDEELPEIVRLQAATRLSTPVEQLVFDYLPLPKLDDRSGRAVLLFTFDAQKRQRLQQMAELAGVDLGAVGTSATTIGESVVHAGLEVRAKLHVPTLVVYQCQSRVELSIFFDQGRLIFSHAMQLTGGDDAGHVQPLKAELSRSLIALEQVHHGVQIERVLLIQEGAPDEHVLGVLNERFADRVQQISVARDLSHVDGIADLDGSAVSGVTLGAIFAIADPRLAGIDFLNPRKVEAKRDERILRWGLIAAGVLVVLGMGGFFYNSALSARDRQIASLEEEQAELKTLVESPEAVAMFEAAGDMAEWQSKNLSPLDTLAEFQELLPSTRRLYFEDLSFSPGRGEIAVSITGNGVAKERRDIVELEQKLDEYGYDVRSTTPDESGNPDFPLSFVLDVELQHDEEDQAGVDAG